MENFEDNKGYLITKATDWAKLITVVIGLAALIFLAYCNHVDTIYIILIVLLAIGIFIAYLRYWIPRYKEALELSEIENKEDENTNNLIS